MNKRLNILVANDDGIASPGLLRLGKRCRAAGRRLGGSASRAVQRHVAEDNHSGGDKH